MRTNETIRSLIIRLAEAPYVGNLVQIAIAAYRGPETRFAVLQRLAEQAPASPPVTAPMTDDVRNLVMSTPVALRRLTRELETLKQRVATQDAELERLRDELRRARGEQASNGSTRA